MSLLNFFFAARARIPTANVRDCANDLAYDTKRGPKESVVRFFSCLLKKRKRGLCVENFLMVVEVKGRSVICTTIAGWILICKGCPIECEFKPLIWLFFFFFLVCGKALI